jgi:hypothetical protein
MPAQLTAGVDRERVSERLYVGWVTLLATVWSASSQISRCAPFKRGVR